MDTKSKDGLLSERSEKWIEFARLELPQSVKRKLLSHFSEPAEILAAKTSALESITESRWPHCKSLRQLVDWKGVQIDRLWAGRPTRRIIGLSDGAYPPLLREIQDPPVVLYAQGDCSLMLSRGLAIVGSRNPTPIGRETAMNIAKVLAAEGHVIVSGLAAGIDAAAHMGALESYGSTIAVCASGLDIVYPRQHFGLARRISETGLLLSEYPPGTGVRRHHFPYRNRLISGMTLGTLVVEATRKSGSLITARYAADQGREVFDVPGSVYSRLSKGPHQLIKEGASLVASIADIQEELPVFGSLSVPTPTQRTTDRSRDTLLDAIDYIPTSVDQIIVRSGLTAAKVCSMLIGMEIAGKIRNCDGRYLRNLET